jgi:hypothetical protein
MTKRPKTLDVTVWTKQPGAGRALLTAFEARGWSELRNSGGIRDQERLIMDEAHANIERARKQWLAALIKWEQDWHRRFGNGKPGRRDREELSYIIKELGNLRRLLGVPLSVEEGRKRTRERQRQFRERQRRSGSSPSDRH